MRRASRGELATSRSTRDAIAAVRGRACRSTRRCRAGRSDPAAGRLAAREQLAAFWLTLDAINFGSGWFPTLRKRPGRSGYYTIARASASGSTARGPWSAAELAEIDAGELAAVARPGPEHELMALFAARCATSAATSRPSTAGGSRLSSTPPAARPSALAELLGRLGLLRRQLDATTELDVPFLKRAQIAAADLARAGVAEFDDLDRLTMFADNLVPHVLRLDGILRFDPELVARIDREELIEHGSPEEVEIRACALHAVELIVGRASGQSCPAEVDQMLWHRGQEPRYKASAAPPLALHRLSERPRRSLSRSSASRRAVAIASAPASPTSSSARDRAAGDEIERREAAGAGQRGVERDHRRLAAERRRRGRDHRQRAAVDDVARGRQRLARRVRMQAVERVDQDDRVARRGRRSGAPGRSRARPRGPGRRASAAKLTAAAGSTGPLLHSEISSGRTPASASDSCSSSWLGERGRERGAAPRSCRPRARRRSSPASPCRTASATRSP